MHLWVQFSFRIFIFCVYLHRCFCVYFLPVVTDSLGLFSFYRVLSVISPFLDFSVVFSCFVFPCCFRVTEHVPSCRFECGFVDAFNVMSHACAYVCIQEGKTALDYAKHEGHHDVARLIEVRCAQSTRLQTFIVPTRMCRSVCPCTCLCVRCIDTVFKFSRQLAISRIVMP